MFISISSPGTLTRTNIFISRHKSLIEELEILYYGVGENFNWRRWLRIATNRSKHNVQRNINDDWGDDFQIWDWMLFYEHQMPNFELDECDNECLSNYHLFWDTQSEYVYTQFIPELGIIAFDIYFDDHGYSPLYFPIWELSIELNEEMLKFD